MSNHPTTSKSNQARVLEIAKLLRADAERLVALKQFFQAGDAESMFGALGPFVEGHVATVVRGASIVAMSMACARAWDSGARDLHTIHSARLALKHEGTFNLVASHGDQIALSKFVHLVDEMKGDYSQQRLRDFRNYHLAHHIPNKLTKVDTPKLQHLWNAIDDTLRVIFFLGSGTGINAVSFDAVGDVWRERCHAYWRRLIGGPQGRQLEVLAELENAEEPNRRNA